MKLNCAELSSTLADDDLFGHAKGAFTGATGERKGLLRKADKGTLFLDEFGDLPQVSQVKLLTLLETRKLRPQGSDAEIDVDVRFIAATSVDLESRCREGVFRRDLLQRFVANVALPPLRERREDIGELARELLLRFRNEEGANSEAEGFTERTIEVLRQCDWPGNVRELEHVIKNALALTYESRKKLLDVGDFELAPPTSSDSQERELARISIRAFAASLLDDLDRRDSSGIQIQPLLSIEDLANRHDDLSLLFSIANLFTERFRGKRADEKARRLFGYTTAESVRSIIRRRRDGKAS